MVSSKQCLLLASITSICAVVYSTSTVVGLVIDDGTSEPLENSGKFEVCVKLKNSTNEQPIITAIKYHSITALADEDFVDEPINITVSAAADTSCFNVSIIDDEFYEEAEEFSINLTSLQSTVLMPSAIRIQIVDQDSITIGWERAEYIISEEVGQLEVCARLTGRLAVPPPTHQVTLLEQTAREGTDYSRLHEALDFSVGGNKTQCFYIEIITDDAVEPEKQFQVHIVPNQQQPNIHLVNHTATITIVDYSAQSNETSPSEEEPALMTEERAGEATPLQSTTESPINLLVPGYIAAAAIGSTVFMLTATFAAMITASLVKKDGSKIGSRIVSPKSI